MTQYTRRTHIVRIYSKNSDGTKNKNKYFDVEVLDAIAFRIENGKEVVIKCPAASAQPYIVDDTGNGLEKSPSAAAATRRTHVKEVKGENDTAVLIEVLDAMACSDTNGGEWILVMPKSNVAPNDVTDGTTSGTSSTRRTHNEKISGATPPKADPTSNYLTVERCDMIAFRTIMGKEVILKLKSHDDGNGSRASTYTWSPTSIYDPKNDKATDIPENDDPHFYVKFNKDGKSPLVGKEKLACGPMWWIRKIKWGGNPAVYIVAHAGQTGPGLIAPDPSITVSGPSDDNGNPILDVGQGVFTYQRQQGSTTTNSVWCAWPGFLANPTSDNYNNSVNVQPQIAPFAVYGGEFYWNGTMVPGNPPPTPSSGGGNGLFGDEAGCQSFCDAFNRIYGDGAHFYARYWNSDNVVIESGGASILAPVQVILQPIVTEGSSAVTGQFVVQLPSTMQVGDSFAISVNCSGNGRTSVSASGFIDGTDSVDAAQGQTQDPVESPPDVTDGSAFKGPTDYVVTVTMVANNDPNAANPNRISVVVSGGDGGGHGGGPQ